VLYSKLFFAWSMPVGMVGAISATISDAANAQGSNPEKMAKKKFPANAGNGFRNCGLSRKVFVPIKYRNCNFFSVC